MPRDNGDDRFRMIGAKNFGDGSLFAGNIWLSQPYLTNQVTLKNLGLPKDFTGHMNYASDELRTLVMNSAANGWQVSTHAQGDRTVEVVLDVYEEALAANPDACRPFRLEHCSMMTEAQIDRAIALGVVSSFLLPPIYYWGDAVRDYLFGAERVETYVPFGSAVRKGMRASFHCDPPMTWPNPLLLLYVALTRRSRAGNVIGASQRVGIDEALRAVTIDAAWHLGMADKIGSLEPGKSADFVVLGDNPRKVDAEDLSAIPIHGTWVAGAEVWNAADGTHRPIDYADPLPNVVATAP